MLFYHPFPEFLQFVSGTLLPSSGHRPATLLLLCRFSRVQLCVTPQTAAHQAPLSLGFSRREYRSGVPSPSPDVVHTVS